MPSSDRPLAHDHALPTVDVGCAPRSASITVVIVDPLRLVAEGLGGTLVRSEDMEVVAIAGSCADAFRAVARHRPDVVLLEQYLPDGLGTDSVAAMVELCPLVKVLMVTADDGRRGRSGSVRARPWRHAGGCGHRSRVVARPPAAQMCPYAKQLSQPHAATPPVLSRGVRPAVPHVLPEGCCSCIRN